MLTRLKRRTFRFQSCLKRAKASNILLIALFAATSMIWLMSFTRSSGANSALPMKTNSYIVEGGADDDEGLFTIGTEGQLNVTAAVLASSAGAVPFRVLFVCDVEVYDKKALPYTRWFIHLYKATSRLPGVEASIWGPGFSEYDEEGTLAENIKARWGSPTYFDFAFNYTTRYASQRVWRGPGVGGPPVAVLFKDCVMYEKLPSGSYSEVFP